MKNSKKTFRFIAIAALVNMAGLCRAQSSGQPHYGALEYSLPLLTIVPPSYSGEPANISAAYLLLDLAMRRYSWDTTDKFLGQMAWGDTAKYVTGMIYNVMHDNPIAFAQWEGWHQGYINSPGHAMVSLLNRLWNACPDTGRTEELVRSAIIADVMVVDTFGVFDPTAALARNDVLVTCQILDSIKGKYVTSCPSIYKSHKKGATPQSADTPQPTFAVPAVPGSCLQFEYSLEWSRTPSPGGDVGRGLNPLYDSVNGTWIKPGTEYIVFLQFQGIGGDSANFYFTTWPLLQGTCAGMYPVKSGIVYDPNDDFGIGASSGLTVSVWKSRLRARISTLTGE